jgi:hypothetical protein
LGKASGVTRHADEESRINCRAKMLRGVDSPKTAGLNIPSVRGAELDDLSRNGCLTQDRQGSPTFL